jgi:SAM-dependent methyltransferase
MTVDHEHAPPACVVCGNSRGNRTFTAREMMFGLRDEFEYVECGACGCLQIASVPDDLGRYYPEDYYSFKPASTAGTGIRQALLAYRTADQIGYSNPLGRLLTRLTGNEPYAWGRRAGVRREDSVLDIGCGSGWILAGMRRAGYSRLVGIDPFIPGSVEEGPGFRIMKMDASQLDGEFDFVMMHHAFEHVPDPAAMLGEIHRLLKPGKLALLRIPVADSYAWRKYGTNWVQLDAPRHLFLHTRRSIEALASAAGLELVDVIHDSTGLQFWGSEEYARDIPHTNPRSVAGDSPSPIFTRRELRRFEVEAKELNRRGEGDQACFYLRKPK